MNKQLTSEEQVILASVENGEWRSVQNLAQEIARYRSYAEAQEATIEEVKIEIATQDLQSLRDLAQQANVPVQQLMANVLHQYAAASR